MKLSSFLVILAVSIGLICLGCTKAKKSFLKKTADIKSTNIISKIVPLKIGETTIHICLSSLGNSDIIYFNMHDNENTSVKATKVVIKEYGGILVEIRAENQRLISFSLEGNLYIFDPNRIFTDKGIKNTLVNYGKYSKNAEKEIHAFTNSLRKYLLEENIKVIVAVHNNTDGGYSVKSYMDGGKNPTDSKEVFWNRNTDPDDFFFVTEKRYFDYLKAKRVNVVLQNNKSATDDGSLSVYCGKNGIPYINVEAQHMHLIEQVEMLKLVQYLIKV